jgi:hypothetical protein
MGCPGINLRPRQSSRFAKVLKWSQEAATSAQTAAALRLLPIYKHVTHGLIMQQDVMWQQATEALMKQARLHHTVRTPVATTCLTTFEYLCSQVLKVRCVGKLFPNTTTEEMLHTFRLCDPRTEAKSVRRGSLQCLVSPKAVRRVLPFDPAPFWCRC